VKVSHVLDPSLAKEVKYPSLTILVQFNSVPEFHWRKSATLWRYFAKGVHYGRGSDLIWSRIVRFEA
jgi:hypothetical protein